MIAGKMPFSVLTANTTCPELTRWTIGELLQLSESALKQLVSGTVYTARVTRKSRLRLQNECILLLWFLVWISLAKFFI